jgi:nonsense-mediated mRNA decay protein 3
MLPLGYYYYSASLILKDFVIEYVVTNLFCDSCHKVEAKETWVAVCQVRQHVNHKRTFLWLEQMILKHKAHSHCISYVLHLFVYCYSYFFRIKEQPDGLDFFFGLQNQCVKFLTFIQTILPIRYAFRLRFVILF